MKSFRRLSNITILFVMFILVVSCGGTPVKDGGTFRDLPLEGNISVTENGDHSLTANYTGSEPVTYEWKKDGVTIPNFTGATFTPSEPGEYTVTVTSPGHLSKTSDPVTVAGLTLDGNVRINENKDGSLTAIYSGIETPVEYQWLINDEPISGATNQTFTPTIPGSYRVIAKVFGYLPKTSDSLSISGLPLKGNIVITENGDGTLTANYTGDETPVAYQWLKDGEVIDGATNATFTPTAPGSYLARVSVEGYNPKIGHPAVISGLPLSGTLTVTKNADGTLTAEYKGNEGTPTYQWLKDNTLISGATGTTFTPTAPGSYIARATIAGYIPKVSDPVNITGLTLAGSVAITDNGDGTLKGDYTGGTEPVTYEWKKDGVTVATGQTFTPTTPGNYTVTVAAAGYTPKTSLPIVVATTLTGDVFIEDNGNGSYTAKYNGFETPVIFQWNKDGQPITAGTTFTPTEAGSYTVTATVTGYDPKTSAATVIANQSLSGNVTITQNGDGSLAANYSGSERPLTYQWNKNGAPISGATGQTFAPTAPGSYTVTVAVANYTPKNSTAVNVDGLELTGNIAVTQGNDGTLTAKYTGNENITPTYQWFKDGQPISGATGATFKPTAPGSYTVTVTATGYAPKTGLPINITGLPLAGDVTVSKSNGTLTAGYTGTETPVTYQWNKDGVAIAGATSAAFTPTVIGDYSVTATVSGYLPKTSLTANVAGLPLAGNINITRNEDGVLAANYTGTESPITYQWSRDGTLIGNAANQTYKPTVIGNYTVTVSAAGYNSKTSAPVNVTGLHLTGTISVIPNDNGTLTAKYTGTETPVSYQWLKDNVLIVPSVTMQTFTPTTPGLYSVQVSVPGYLSETSPSVNVSGLTLTGGITITNNNGTLTADYTGAETPVTYEWKKDGEVISATSASFVPGEMGVYTVTVSVAGYLPKTSLPFLLAKNLSGDVIITDNGDGTLTATYNGNEGNGLPISYEWLKDGQPMDPPAVRGTLSLTETGAYTATVTIPEYYSKTSEPKTMIAFGGDLTINRAGNELVAYYNGGEQVAERTYGWYLDNVIIDGAQDYMIMPDTNGGYVVSMKAAGYIPKTSEPFPVTLLEMGGVALDAYEGGELVATYSGTPPANFVWEWLLNQELIPGEASSTYTAREAGTYTVIAKAPGYAKSSADVYVAGVYCADAIKISTATSLSNVRNNLTANYELVNDIDVSGFTNWTPIGNTTPFTGQFCGNGFEVKGLTITGGGTNSQSAGLFGYLGDGAIVREVGVSVKNIAGYGAVGGIAGTTKGNVKITNVYTTGIINNTYGVVSSYGGGIVGVNNGTLRIESSYTTVAVSISQTLANGFIAAGGILGYNGSGSKVTIINSYSSGDVYAKSAFTTRAGGILGDNATEGASSATVESCYAAGKVTSETTALIAINVVAAGISIDGTVRTSAALNTSVLAKGGLLAITQASRVGGTENNFALSSMTVNGSTLVGLISLGSADGSSKTLAQLQTQATYENVLPNGLGWKFGDNVGNPWKWSDTLKRPILYWQK